MRCVLSSSSAPATACCGTGAGAAITFYGLELVPGDKGPPLVWLVLQTGVSMFIGAMGALHLLTLQLHCLGSVDAAVQAYWGGPINASDPATKMKLELGMPNGVPGPGVSTVAQVEDDIKTWEDKLNSIGDDAQLANVDLQNMLQKQQQTLQMMSNISKALHDTAMAVIRKMGG